MLGIFGCSNFFLAFVRHFWGSNKMLGICLAFRWELAAFLGLRKMPGICVAFLRDFVKPRPQTPPPNLSLAYAGHMPKALRGPSCTYGICLAFYCPQTVGLSKFIYARHMPMSRTAPIRGQVGGWPLRWHMPGIYVVTLQLQNMPGICQCRAQTPDLGSGGGWPLQWHMPGIYVGGLRYVWRAKYARHMPPPKLAAPRRWRGA